MRMATTTRPYRKVARAVGEGRTRTALLDAAEAAFRESGWEQASLEAIAHRAGVTKQTLLRHFGSKDGLREAASRRALAAVSAQRLAAPTDDVAGAVDNLLEHYAAYGEMSLR